MKIMMLLSSALISVTLSAQNCLLSEGAVTPPAFHNELYTNINDYVLDVAEYPLGLINTGVQGTEVIRFVITPSGRITNIKVINSISDSIDKKMIDVLKTTDNKWLPGTVDGKPVAMEKELSVLFIIHSKENMVKIARNYQETGNYLFYIRQEPENAIRYLNKAITLLPNEEGLLATRGLCYYQLGSNSSAERDWKRIAFLSEKNMNKPMFDSIGNKYILPNELEEIMLKAKQQF